MGRIFKTVYYTTDILHLIHYDYYIYHFFNSLKLFLLLVYEHILAKGLKGHHDPCSIFFKVPTKVVWCQIWCTNVIIGLEVFADLTNWISILFIILLLKTIATV